MKYFIQIFGCQMNRSDAERIAGMFESMGLEAANNSGAADIFVAVMCSVRQMAADRVFGLEQKIKTLKKRDPKAVALLTGCVVKDDETRFSAIFDRVLDIKTLSQWPDILGIGNSHSEVDYFKILPKHGRTFSVLVPISKGCDNYCSYCVVPYTRGPLVSRPATDILKETKLAVAGGAKEIWLLGQNVNNYRDGKINFAALLRLINDIPGEFWIRFTSPHPKDFTDEAVESFARCLKVAPYLNLPIQSGDDKVLKSMNRPYTRADYMNLVKKIRVAFKASRLGLEREVAISTDVICGFCGETREQFADTVKTFKAIKYDMAYIAEYSARPGTAAQKMTDNVSEREKKRRKNIIDRIVKATALVRGKKYSGKTVEVLLDEIKNGFGLGKTRSYKTVKFEIGGQNVKAGDIVKIKITKVMAFGLVGKIVEERI